MMRFAKAKHAQGGLTPASIHVFKTGWCEKVHCMSGAPGTARRSPFECHPSQVHMYTTACSHQKGYC
jgi:hypothetical protein